VVIAFQSVSAPRCCSRRRETEERKQREETELWQGKRRDSSKSRQSGKGGGLGQFGKGEKRGNSGAGAIRRGVIRDDQPTVKENSQGGV